MVTNHFQWQLFQSPNHIVNWPKKYFPSTTVASANDNKISKQSKRVSFTDTDTNEVERNESLIMAELKQYILPLQMANNVDERYWKYLFGENYSSTGGNDDTDEPQTNLDLAKAKEKQMKNKKIK